MSELVALANEYRRIERQIEAKAQQLAALLAANGEAGEFPTDFAGARPRRYSIELDFKPGVLVPQERSVTIDAGTIFRCAAIESFLFAVGTANDPFTAAATTVQATFPWDQRLIHFDYLWRVRDTGTDREWVDRPQPSLFGSAGYFGPLWFPRRNVLGGGTTVFATIDPFLSVVTPGNNGFFANGTVNRYTVQMSFIGHEVPDGGAL